MNAFVEMELMACLMRELKERKRLRLDDLPFCLRRLSPRVMTFLSRNTGFFDMFLAIHAPVFHFEGRDILLKFPDVKPPPNREHEGKEPSRADREVEFFNALMEQLEDGCRICLQELPHCLKTLSKDTVIFFMSKSPNDNPVYKFLTHHSDVFQVGEDNVVSLRQRPADDSNDSASDDDSFTDSTSLVGDEEPKSWKEAYGIVTRIGPRYGFIKSVDTVHPFKYVYFPASSFLDGSRNCMFDCDISIGDTVLMDVILVRKGRYRATYVKPTRQSATRNKPKGQAPSGPSKKLGKGNPNASLGYNKRQPNPNLPNIATNPEFTKKKNRHAHKEPNQITAKDNAHVKPVPKLKNKDISVPARADHSPIPKQHPTQLQVPPVLDSDLLEKLSYLSMTEAMRFRLPTWDLNITAEILSGVVVPTIMDKIRGIRQGQTLREKAGSRPEDRYTLEMQVQLKPV